MNETTLKEKASSDPYIDRFYNSPAYETVMKDTIASASYSYKLARVLSVVLFGVGIVLIGIAVVFGFIRNEETLSLIFGGLGTADLIALLLYRPIERIQSGVDDLIKSQITCLSFLAQYDSIARALATMSTLKFDDPNRKEMKFESELALGQHLRESASQLIADLD